MTHLVALALGASLGESTWHRDVGYPVEHGQHVGIVLGYALLVVAVDHRARRRVPSLETLVRGRHLIFMVILGWFTRVHWRSRHIRWNKSFSSADVRDFRQRIIGPWRGWMKGISLHQGGLKLLVVACCNARGVLVCQSGRWRRWHVGEVGEHVVLILLHGCGSACESKKKKKEKGEGRGCKVLCSDAEIDNAIVAFEFQCRKMKMMEMVCRLYLKRDIKFCDA